ncbi:Predicted dehydrogenase [Phaffia rhodozyma]|uniref:Predicted dehydrogenase n=1 Tax=Phaffia rhodozyma TaxID=264483 RepID=A0A0F7SGZ9_PHARH|nr:Predicted dehydrogenase [Phaffia rhodozyma]
MSPKTIILTGASRGLGLSILKLLLLPPFSAQVISISRSLPRALLDLKKQNPDRLQLIQGNVNERYVSEKAVESARAWGGVDSIILNAGVLEPLGKVADIDVAKWQAHLETNFLSLLHTIQVALPDLRRSKGSIVMVSSGASVKGTQGWGVYATGKAAMNSLARTLGEEEKDVLTVAIRPGVVNTDMQTLIRSTGEECMTPKDYQNVQRLYAEGELLDPEDPGYVFAALAARGGPMDLSGKFLSWNEEALKDYQKPV